MSSTDPSQNHSNPLDKFASSPIRKHRRLFWFTFILALLISLVLHRCYQEAILKIPPLPAPVHGEAKNASQDSSFKPAIPLTPKILVPTTLQKPKLVLKEILPKAKIVLSDSAPYVYADPWGGRHFDSVEVKLFCRGNCVVLYSLEDSIHFKSYENPLTFRRNTTLWITAVDSLARQTQPLRIEYIIEKDQGLCRRGMMPLTVKEKNLCMDIYEWPNKAGELPQASVNQAQAADSCQRVGKRLCALDEWQSACHGPAKDAYPYGPKYNTQYCVTKENAAERSGRTPACRSYYGNMDMTGNLWEWTSTPAPENEDFFWVVGGQWSTGPEGTCSLHRYSFYPQNQYPFVGFRCCAEMDKK